MNLKQIARRQAGEGFIPLIEYAAKYGMHKKSVYEMAHASGHGYKRIGAYQFLKDAPPPRKVNGRWERRYM